MTDASDDQTVEPDTTARPEPAEARPDGDAGSPPAPPPVPAEPGIDERTREIDKAEAAGYPPDNGPETRVIKVRRCWFRSRTGRFVVAVAVLIACVTGLIWIPVADRSRWWNLLFAPGALVPAGLLAWWWIDRFSAALVITTKRTTMHRGFFRRSTSEVVHDNIRNIQVDQNFWQRVWKVGKIGISSSGQDGVEVQVNHLPNPDKLREIIDLYRPL
ncbi:MAG: PH domain-containing protein [Planctomycetota bacterium]